MDGADPQSTTDLPFAITPGSAHAPDPDLREDVAVVGAGPAGCAAAITLARAGRSVLLADKASFPRDKCCGDGLTTLALRELEALGLGAGAVASWHQAHAATLVGPDGRRIDLRLPEGRGSFSVVARRMELDSALLDRARRPGVSVWQGRACTAVAPDGEGVTLTFADGASVRAGHTIAADGVWSDVRRLIGATVPGFRGNLHAFRQYASGLGEEARTRLMVWFEPDLLPGYLWSFPLGDGTANLGFGVPRGGRIASGDLGRLWPALLERPHIRQALGADLTLLDRARAWPIPAQLGAVPLARGRVLFCGDAAALTDPLTGEGIGQALISGRWAAETITRVSTTGESAGVVYDRTVRRELGADYRLAALLGRFFNDSRRVRWSLRAVDTNDWTRRNFARWLFEDYPRALLATPRRWRRGMFGGDGAFPPVAPFAPVGGDR